MDTKNNDVGSNQKVLDFVTFGFIEGNIWLFCYF